MTNDINEGLFAEVSEEPEEAAPKETALKKTAPEESKKPTGTSPETSLAALAVQTSTCTLCELAKGRTNVVFGRGGPNADLMFIGEGPGAEEDEQGLPFVGRSGRLLQQLIAEEISTDESAESGIYIANMVKCRPPGNRQPTPEEVATCRPYLDQQIQLIQPKVIVTLGNSATKPLLDTQTGITRLRGQIHQVGNYKVIPTFHPSAILRDPNKETFLRQDLALAKKILSQNGE